MSAPGAMSIHIQTSWGWRRRRPWETLFRRWFVSPGTHKTNMLYIFALQTKNGLQIDAFLHDLSDSDVFEEIDVAAGLVAWDELGRFYRFEPRLKCEGVSGSWDWTAGPDDPELLRRMLVDFLNSITRSRRHRRRAAAVEVSLPVPEDASLTALVGYVKKLDLVNNY